MLIFHMFFPHVKTKSTGHLHPLTPMLLNLPYPYDQVVLREHYVFKTAMFTLIRIISRDTQHPEVYVYIFVTKKAIFHLME